ncbi:class F sortase [Arthrobacter sp. zg-Y1219]|uniref:class F sortase n=1 Tax=Arthrobacter sp. zg-Y1219 TaxID=3049067 RepID=UPI0024C4729E|nr:class F sortase [Arthrobacter sp. zg-Y1219]MDK1359226.1 class F sortase [Arthrobacter sp. zg-Y1219]
MTRPAPSRRRLWAGAALAAALVAGSTACGQEAADEPTSAPPAAAPASPAPSPTAATPTAAAPIDIRPAVPEPAVSIPRPVRVQVEGTGIDLEVIPGGVEANGAMALPDNHDQAAWYRYGPAPGAEEGSSVLAAHVDSRTEQLPIAGLKDVPAGTVVTVTREDGSVLRYAAEGVDHIAKKSLDGHRLFDRTGEPRLKLVTCGGQWLEAQDDYEDNVVLTAAPVS